MDEEGAVDSLSKQKQTWEILTTSMKKQEPKTEWSCIILNTYSPLLVNWNLINVIMVKESLSIIYKRQNLFFQKLYYKIFTKNFML